MRALSTLASLVLLNLLWFLCSLPLFTIGSAISALYDCVFRLDRGESAGWKAFFQSFRTNFRRSTVLWLIVLLVFGILCLDFHAMLVNAWPMRSFLLAGIPAVAIFAAIPLPYLFLPSQIEGLFTSIRSSFLLSIRYLPRTIMILALWLIPFLWLLLFPFSFWRLAWVWFGFGFAGIAYLSGKLMKSAYSQKQ